MEKPKSPQQELFMLVSCLWWNRWIVMTLVTALPSVWWPWPITAKQPHKKGLAQARCTCNRVSRCSWGYISTLRTLKLGHLHWTLLSLWAIDRNRWSGHQDSPTFNATPWHVKWLMHAHASCCQITQLIGICQQLYNIGRRGQQFFSPRKGLSCLKLMTTNPTKKIRYVNDLHCKGLLVSPCCQAFSRPPRVLRFQLARRVLLVLDQVPVEKKIKLGISKQDIQPCDHDIAYPAIITSREHIFSKHLLIFCSIIYSDCRIEIHLAQVAIIFDGTNSFTFYQETSGDAIQYKS